MKIRTFITHKKAESYAQCQDYFAINPQRRAIAVADGLSQSIFPKWWAEILAKAYTDGIDVFSQLKPLQEKWLEKVKTRIAEKESTKPGSAWRIESNLAVGRGAGATLCGINFNDYEWSSFILGDTSIIEIDDNLHIVRILNSNANGFSNHPDYIDSLDASLTRTPSTPKGTIKPDHILLAVSDPLGHFFDQKQKTKEEKCYLQELLNVNSHEEFIKLVDNWRDNHHLHDDDTTCIIIENNETPDFEYNPDYNLETLIKSDIKPDLVTTVDSRNSGSPIIAQSPFDVKSVIDADSLKKKDDIALQRAIDNNVSSTLNLTDSETLILATCIDMIIRILKKYNKIKASKLRHLINSKFPSIEEIIKKVL